MQIKNNLKKIVKRGITFFSNRTKIVDKTEEKVEKFIPSRNILLGFFGIVSFSCYLLVKNRFNYNKKKISYEEIISEE